MRHRSRAGFRIGDDRHLDLFRYVAWLVAVRHEPRPKTERDPYEELINHARKAWVWPAPQSGACWQCNLYLTGLPCGCSSSAVQRNSPRRLLVNVVPLQYRIGRGARRNGLAPRVARP